MNAPAAINLPPALPINPEAASAKGFSDVANEGKVPMQTICIKI